MRFTTLLRDLKYRYTYGPQAKYVKTLPAGVRRMTDAESNRLAQERQQLKVLWKLTSFYPGPNVLEQHLGAKLYARLLKERRRFEAKHCRDFSCGIGLCFTRSGESTFFEPYDLQRKLDAHLTAFLKRRGFEV